MLPDMPSAGNTHGYKRSCTDQDSCRPPTPAAILLCLSPAVVEPELHKTYTCMAPVGSTRSCSRSCRDRRSSLALYLRCKLLLGLGSQK